MSLKLGLMKDLIWVLQFDPLKHVLMEKMLIHEMGSHYYNKTELH